MEPYMAFHRMCQATMKTSNRMIRIAMAIAVHLLRGGADVRHVQAFLGNTSLDTTKIYLRMVLGRLKEEYEKAMPEIAVGLDGGGLASTPPTPTVRP